ncbi:cytochrome c oxidase subunit 7B, mitochondrial [Danio rerio]|uniref:Cytochrome c oxidase subunit 7B, mitochondrial n=1 Tax=Danio rerio TaxID=7955 RepID=B3DJA6_DANRE|nr:cytochrome c oxidase subunit 7B, mitochondrial [Danio rerio]AAI63415.1 Zgc:194876 [Danio rerio]AAI63420.1 Zgc:194876 [Danio rerio]|eukprot:NP_001124074.1 cytochrome c oxidase subunit 7B [Danio rerio]
MRTSLDRSFPLCHFVSAIQFKGISTRSQLYLHINMYRFAKAALNLSGQSARQVAVRQKSDLSPEFHNKYGAPLLIAGATFCTAVWAYVITSTGIAWNLSPVGKVQPKEWKE